jgi:hypothetical protein
VKIVSKFGIARKRCIWIKEEDNLIIADTVKNLDGFKDAYMNLPEALERSIYIQSNTASGSMDLQNDKYNKIYEDLRAEVKELDFSVWYDLLKNHDMSSADPCLMLVTITTKDDGKTVSVPVDPDVTPKAHAAIIEAFSENSVSEIKRVKEEFNRLLKNESSGSDAYMSISFEGVSADGQRAWNYYDELYPAGDDYYEKYADDHETTKYIIEELEKAASAGEKPHSGAYIFVYFTADEYDENGYFEKTKEYSFVIAHPEDLLIPEDNYYRSN